MDPNWKSDTALGETALSLGNKVVEMYHSCGVPIPRTYFDPQGPHKNSPSENAEETFIECFILDALDFASLDPQKIIDEYQRMQKVADAIDTDGSDPALHLGTANALILANWQGEAAIAFGEQMAKITKFMDQQSGRLVYAMQAMGTAFGLAVQFRQSYFELAESTIEACRAVIAKRPAEPSLNSFMFALGSEMVQVAVEAIGTKDPKELVKVGIGWFKEKFEASKKSASIDGGDAAQVLASYLASRQRLRESFEGGLNNLGAWLDNERSAYFSLPVPILEPMPACTDVHSPDFSYAKFFNDGHDAGTYTPKVEEQRKQIVDENPGPDGPIHRRLKGEE